MENIIPFENSDLSCKIDTLNVDGQIWFKGKDIALALDYSDSDQAIRNHVEDEDKIPLSCLSFNPVNFTGLRGNAKQALFINESGLYSLIFNSKKKEAKVFKHWVTSEVLPSIRKTGTYTLQKQITLPQIQILNETNLHHKVVDFVRRFYPDVIMIPGLGELQCTSDKRTDAYHKGYVGGQPDLLILNQHKYYNGLALELKSPTGKGVLSDKQKTFLQKLADNNYLTIISCDYDEIIFKLINYFSDIRVTCKCCNRAFKSQDSLKQHLIHFHRSLVT